MDSGPAISEDFRTACVHARGGYILANTKNHEVRVSPQCPFLFSLKICAYGYFNICIFINIKIKN